jgi:riboflavin synthase
MFTGIVEETGTVRALRPGGVARLEITCSRVLEGTAVGDSISVNGCCLTVTEHLEGAFATEMMGETLARTSLGSLAPGSPVNLERALHAGSRLGGHMVQGHVDGVGEVQAVEEPDHWTVMRFTLPAALERYVVEKGSITVDGASLTVMAVAAGTFDVGLIPHTLAVTVLGRRRPGDLVNLEVDIVAKYVERLLAAGVASPYTEQRSSP